jgi:hypothetical protein
LSSYLTPYVLQRNLIYIREILLLMPNNIKKIAHSIYQTALLTSESVIPFSGRSVPAH